MLRCGDMETTIYYIYVPLTSSVLDKITYVWLFLKYTEKIEKALGMVYSYFPVPLTK